MFPRIREIVDSEGARLRVSVDAHPTGAVVLLEIPGSGHASRIMLDGYGTELLGGYIMSARLSLPHGLPDEYVAGRLSTRFQLVRQPEASILITQHGAEGGFAIPSPFWDKLYAELCMVVAHVRDLARHVSVRVH